MVNPTEVLPDVIRFVVDKLEAIQYAVANHHIKMLVPTILRCGADFERDRFAELVEQARTATPPGDQLQRARKWFSQSLSLPSVVEHKREHGDHDVCRVMRLGFLAMVENPVAATQQVRLVAAPPNEGAMSLVRKTRSSRRRSRWTRIASKASRVRFS